MCTLYLKDQENYQGMIEAGTISQTGFITGTCVTKCERTNDCPSNEICNCGEKSPPSASARCVPPLTVLLATTAAFWASMTEAQQPNLEDLSCFCVPETTVTNRTAKTVSDEVAAEFTAAEITGIAYGSWVAVAGVVFIVGVTTKNFEVAFGWGRATMTINSENKQIVLR